MAQDYETSRGSIIGRRVSWGAVFAGVVVGMAIQLLLALFGVAIGASVAIPAHGETAGKGIAIGTGIWLLISGIVAAYIGACVAAYLSASNRKSDRMLHGVLSWALATLVTAFVLGSALGGLVGSAMRVASSTVGGLSQGYALRMSGEGTAPGQWNAGVNAPSSQPREPMGGAGVPSGELRGTGAQAGETAAKAAAGGAWWSFVMLLLGLGAAAFAGGTLNGDTTITSQVSRLGSSSVRKTKADAAAKSRLDSPPCFDANSSEIFC